MESCYYVILLLFLLLLLLLFLLLLHTESEKKQRRMDEEMEGKIWAFSDMDDVGFRFTSSSSYGRSSQFISSSIAGPGVNPFLTKSFAISGLTPD